MSRATEGIAIVGMAGRFPGANSIDELWDNLLAGREGITRFAPDQLSPLVPPELASHPRYVAARGVMTDADRFDAAFFGIPPREALLMDPQQRVFLELCWNALEHAGVDPQRFPGSIGVYAGTSNNNYRKLVESRADLLQAAGEFAVMLANEKDYVATRVAHRLDLTGPALSIHTACSTSLVAIAQAWYALMSWQCDLALAGGINIVVPQESGHVPVEGGIESADGHCRPFDAQATGTLFSSGGAVVVLKRLAEAIEQGDTIWAVIRGVAVNNDGGDKASFGAPSVRGQAAVIRQALASAGVGADSIGYVEAHGTGTPLGDPIEVEALTRAFRADTTANQFCWLGSVKGNFGHLVAASGVTGMIKAALALKHGCIPPTLHYRTPNPEIDFAQTPFRVADREITWPRSDTPRRAGVSSFGVGGTNAHIVLEEAPPASSPEAGRAATLLLLSARDEASLHRRAANLAAALTTSSEAELADIGYTLAVGRKPMATRACIVARNVTEACERLATISARAVGAKPQLVFLFPGQGSQHVNMARELVTSEPVFRDSFARCCELATRHLGRDLRALILPPLAEQATAEAVLAETWCTQPALFAVEYALAELWERWGYAPAAMIGHSIGEYVAACRAGVFSLDDAIALVVARGAAMFAQPPGAMLAVRLGHAELAPRLPPGVEIATLNAPEMTVVAGTSAAIDLFAAALAKDEVAATRLRVSHAFHSDLMEAALPVFRRAFDGVRLNPPQRVFYSCVSGAPITVQEATSSDYWCRQLRQPVRFADALRHVLAQGTTLCLEVGPAQALTGLVRSMLDGHGRAIASLGPAKQPGDAAEQLARAVGECWCTGAEPDWTRYFAGQSRRRVGLPGYPFHGERYWIEAVVAPMAPSVATGGGIMQEEITQAPATVSTVPRALRLAAELRGLFESLSGERIGPAQDDASFVDLGLDSLALTQAALELERRYGVKLKFRRLMEDLDSVSRLATLLDQSLPPDAAPAPVAVVTPAAAPAAANPALAQLIQSQMALMSQQAELLKVLSGTSVATRTAVDANAPPVQQPAGEETAQADLKERPFGASARITTRRQFDFTAAQSEFLADFIRRYNARSGKSKAFSQQHRRLMADPRVVTGFNPLWKELVYPIVVERSQGALLWDLDGNEYVDVLNGFGANFLGYQPDCIVDAVTAQMRSGIEIGPQHPLTAEVATLISGMTGMERVAFCNTGSEAVMGAMRIARTVTGRKAIVIFRDSYHGIFDEVIVRGSRQLRSIAAAPGILASAVENVLVLDYGSDEALSIIRERAHDLAAVMIEPVQGRNPTLQPRAFVQELRKLCDAGGCALIFDEVITGFRLAQGGAQEFYGVRADLATYGKIIGGGLPFAAIAGRARWMDALDGGHWQFGDDSYPEAGVTYFAGTFVRHPLALAAARAALTYLKQQGPTLQVALNARTAALIDQLNAVFATRRAPLSAIGASSLWRVRADEDQPCASLFWYGLRYAGLHVYEQFNCFLSAAHGEAEVARIVAAVTTTVDALMGAGLLKPRGALEGIASGVAAMAACADEPSLPASLNDSAELPLETPLSDGQLEKWLGCQYGGAATLAFNESAALTLDGALDVASLKRALATVWSRHEAFRLGFAADGRSQRVHAEVPLPLRELDYAAFADRAEERFTAFCEEQMRLPFDTTVAPLLRFSLVRLDERRHGLHVISHHLVMDGWSLAVFMGELAICYNAYVAGRAPELAAAESFRRYVLDERARRAGGDAASQLEYWKRLYAVPPAPLQLPADRAPTGRPDFVASTERHEFPAELATALKREARRRGVTLYGLLLASFGVLLARLSGQHDFAVAIPFAGQAVAGSRVLIGDGVNTLPLRLDVAHDVPFADLVSRTHGALLDTAEHQDLTLMNILRALGLHRGRAPLTEVIFNLNPRLPDIAFSGLTQEVRDCRRAALMWNLFFNLNDTGRTLTLDLHYATALYDAATIRRWIALYEVVLGAIAQGYEGSIAALPLPAANAAASSAAQPAAIPGEASATALTALIDAQTARTPQRIAVECEGRSLSYAELDRRATAVAGALLARGVGVGELVGICMPRGVEMLIALLGVMKSGAAYVPLDPAFPDQRLIYMATHAQLRHVVALTADTVPAAIAEGRELLALGTLDSATVTSMALPAIDGGDLAYVLYTSGSTGQPKGVRVLHRNLVNFLISMRAQPGIADDDVLCAVTTLSFDIAGLELYLPLIAGARVLIATDEQHRDPDALLRLLRERGATMLQTTPSLLRLLAEGDRVGALRELRLLVGGEQLPRELANTVAAHCRELWNMYGPTETTIWSTLMQVEPGVGAVPLGRPIANTRIHVLDARGQPVPAGEIGEIWIGGDGVADGYLFRPDLSAKQFLPDPFAVDDSRMYRSGDLGSLRDGLLYFHGRDDQQVKLRGYRIELGDIEATALAEPGIREAVAAVHTFGANDQRLVLYAVSRDADPAHVRHLREHLREQLPPYMLPQHIEWLAALPQTPNGKIDRHALPPPAAANVMKGAVMQVATSARVTALADPREEYLAAIWRDLIGVEDVRGGDNFFDLGGHSLLAVEFSTRVQRETSVRLALLEIATGTLASLATELPKAASATGAQSASLLARLRRRLGLR
jgi:amino acid adenylation domain